MLNPKEKLVHKESETVGHMSRKRILSSVLPSILMIMLIFFAMMKLLQNDAYEIWRLILYIISMIIFLVLLLLVIREMYR